MNDDPFVARLRDDLLRGAHHRRRAERRRTVVLTATPLLLALVAAGALLFGREPQDDVTTDGGPSAEVVEACNALLDLHEARRFIDENGIAAAITLYASAAERADDDTLRALVPRLKALPLDVTATTDEDVVEDFIDANQAAEERCRDVRSPGWYPTFVPAELGPEPTVDLEQYGAVQALQPTADADLLPESLRAGTAIAGRGLQPVRMAFTSDGGFIATWTWDDGACQWIGSAVQSGATCGTSGIEPPSTSGAVELHAVAGAIAGFVGPDVSFVVVEMAGRADVQRPAAQTFVVAVEGEVPSAEPLVVRSYDTAGNAIGCVQGRYGSGNIPASTWFHEPCE